MSFKITGLDDLQKNLQNLADKAEALDGQHTVSFEELFIEDFMTSNTQFSSLDELLENGKYDVNSPEDFKAIFGDAFDAYISEVTEFASWEEMLEEATTQYAVGQLGF